MSNKTASSKDCYKALSCSFYLYLLNLDELIVLRTMTENKKKGNP